MKAWIVIAALVAVLYWQHRKNLAKIQPKGPGRRPSGVVRSTGSHARQATQFSSTGSRSPGSGVQTQQPDLQSTWSIGGRYGPGNVGPTYQLPQQSATNKHRSGRAA
jgi:hypothetical protein